MLPMPRPTGAGTRGRTAPWAAMPPRTRARATTRPPAKTRARATTPPWVPTAAQKELQWGQGRQRERRGHRHQRRQRARRRRDRRRCGEQFEQQLGGHHRQRERLELRWHRLRLHRRRWRKSDRLRAVDLQQRIPGVLPRLRRCRSDPVVHGRRRMRRRRRSVVHVQRQDELPHRGCLLRHRRQRIRHHDLRPDLRRGRAHLHRERRLPSGRAMLDPPAGRRRHLRAARLSPARDRARSPGRHGGLPGRDRRNNHRPPSNPSAPLALLAKSTHEDLPVERFRPSLLLCLPRRLQQQLDARHRARRLRRRKDRRRGHRRRGLHGHGRDVRLPEAFGVDAGRPLVPRTPSGTPTRCSPWPGTPRGRDVPEGRSSSSFRAKSVKRRRRVQRREPRLEVLLPERVGLSTTIAARGGDAHVVSSLSGVELRRLPRQGGPPMGLSLRRSRRRQHVPWLLRLAGSRWRRRPTSWPSRPRISGVRNGVSPGWGRSGERPRSRERD